MSEEYYESEQFNELTLSGTHIIGSEYVDCIFSNCTIESVHLSRCRFSECQFRNCNITDLQTDNSYMRFSEAHNCTLTNINWAKLQDYDHFAEPVSKFEKCLLRYNTFADMAMKSFDFSGTDIFDSIFHECILSDSCFNSCKLVNTEFFHCDLRRADFRGATGYTIDTVSNKLKDARFSFPEVINLLSGLGIKIEQF